MWSEKFSGLPDMDCRMLKRGRISISDSISKSARISKGGESIVSPAGDRNMITEGKCHVKHHC